MIHTESRNESIALDNRRNGEKIEAHAGVIDSPHGQLGIETGMAKFLVQILEGKGKIYKYK
jgi:hypothetical protein